MDKCFEGIYRVMFSNRDEVYGMFSAEGEEVELDKKIDANEGEKKGSSHLTPLSAQSAPNLISLRLKREREERSSSLSIFYFITNYINLIYFLKMTWARTYFIFLNEESFVHNLTNTVDRLIVVGDLVGCQEIKNLLVIALLN